MVNSIITHNLPAITAVSVLLISVVAASYVAYQRRGAKRGKVPEEWKSVGKVAKIHLYPLKSGRRIELKSATSTQVGLMSTKESASGKELQLRDRSFLIYKEDNKEFRTARTYPKMVLIETSVHDETHVAFEAPGMRQLYVEIPKPNPEKEFKIILHKDERITSLDCGDEAATWFSRYILNEPAGLRLGFNNADPSNARDLTHTHDKFLKVFPDLGNKATGLYSDLTSVMLVNQASVDDLNNRIDEGTHVTSEHFRGNIILESNNTVAYAEDNWKWLKIGEVIYKSVKPCTRCIFTTIDPDVGVKSEDGEPLTTLRKYRLLDDPKERELYPTTPIMGINLENIKSGTFSVNDEVFVGK